jgi:hypothetical protein
MKKILLFAAMSLLISWAATAQTFVGKNSQTPQQRLNDQYCSGLFQSAEGTVFDVTSDISVKSYLNILDFLQGRVAGLQISHQKDGTAIPIIRNERASIYLDELPISAGTVNMLSSADIAMIKVIKGPFVGAFGNGGGGVIAIYTLKGDGEEEEDEASAR